ncbi:MAG: YfhO family protein [Chitinophagales bacterium]
MRAKKSTKNNLRQRGIKKPTGVSVEKFLKPSSNRWKLLLGLLTGLIIITFGSYLSLQYVYIFLDIGNDTNLIFYPNYLYTAEYLRTEGISMWSFSKGLGQGDYGSGLLNNPFNWILYILGGDKLAYGIVYAEALKILSIGILFFLYLRTVGFTRLTCLIGSLLMAFSGYAILGSTWYGHSKFVFEGVFVLLAFELLFKQNKWWLFPISIMFFLGSKLYFIGIFLLLYSLFRFMDTKGWKPQELLQLYLKMGILGLLGLTFTAPFLGSTVYKFLYSPRVAGDVSYVDSLSSTPIFYLETPLHYLTALTRFFSNDLLGTGSNYAGWKNYLEAPEFYCGLLTLLLIPQLFTFLNRRRKILYACFLGFWIWLIVFPYFRYAFYLFVGDYYKNALSLFIPCSFLFVGLSGLNLIHRSGKVNVKVLFATLFVLLLLLHFPYTAAEGIIDKKLQWMITLILMVHTGILYVWQVKKSYRYQLQWVLLLTVCFEVAYLSHFTVNDRTAISSKQLQSRTGYNDYTKDAVKYLKSVDKSFYRIDKTYSCFTRREQENVITIGSPNDAVALNYYGTPSYDSHNHRYYVRFLQETEVIEKGDEIASRWIVGLIAHPFLESLASVKYVLTKPASDNLVDRGVFKKIHQIEDVQIYQNKFNLPMGITYQQFVPVSEYKKLLNSTQKALALLQAVVVEDEDVEKFKALERRSLEDINQTYQINELNSALIANALQINYHDNNRIEGTIGLPKPKMMFFSIPYDVGWSAKVNGKPADLELVNLGFMGLMLPAGNHTIQLSYLPPYFYQGWMVFFLGLGLYIYLMWRVYWQRK